MNSVALFFILAVVLLVIGVPVATTLGLSSVIFIILEGIPTSTVIQRMFAGADTQSTVKPVPKRIKWLGMIPKRLMLIH